MRGDFSERISNYRAECVADSVMYREALATAPMARGWSAPYPWNFLPKTI